MKKEILEFRFWIIGFVGCVIFVSFMAYQQHRAADKYKNHRTEYCTALLGTPEQKKACEEEGTNARDYLPWRYELFSWPEGITTWAIIFTGFAVAWQSSETRKAARFSRDAIILQHRPKIVIRDVRLTKDKFGNFIVVVTIRNSGSTIAYVSETKFQINWIKRSDNSIEQHLEKVRAFNLKPAERRTFEFTAPEFYIRFEASRILLEENPEQDQTVALGCFAVISYTDAIDTTRETSLNRTYTYKTGEFSVWDKEKDYSD